MIIFSAAPEMGKLYTRGAGCPQLSRPVRYIDTDGHARITGGSEAHPPL
jgi:hypothetical protein